jgi:hypothetical protein
MSQLLIVEQSRAIPAELHDAFRGTLAAPLPEIFHRWYGPISPIKRVEGQVGDWGTVGQSRTLVLTGGGSTREELTRLDEPSSFGYTLSEIKGPLSGLVGKVDGEWSFAPVGTGTNVTWRWTLYPRSAFAAPALPVFARVWRGYARQALEELSKHLAH